MATARRSTDREIGEIHAKVAEIHKTLMGNGQPGLVQNFNSMKSRLDKYEGGMNFITWFVSIFGVATLGMLFAITRLYIS